MKIARFLTGVMVAALGSIAQAAEWQWSVPDGKARAYLWIPPNAKRVRAVVVANHNMIEQGILEHPTMRKTLAELGIAEVWVVPWLEQAFDFHKGADEHFQRVMDALAAESGYQELKFAPAVPLGHSAAATFPWNFAAWNPDRTLAVLSVHGDAPKTHLTGYGRPNVDWGDRKIDGVPGLMVMSEIEWWDERLKPAMDFVAKNPAAPIATLGDAGRGHFDYSDQMVAFLAMFIRKAAEQRLPAEAPLDQPVVLKAVDPKAGWRMDRWRRDQAPLAPAAPYDQYKGNPAEAFWCFDQEMASAAEAIYANIRGKKPQLVGFEQEGKLLFGEPVDLQFLPDESGIRFHLGTAFLPTVANHRCAIAANLPEGSPLGHASGGGPIAISKIVGPVAIVGPETLELQLERSVYVPDRKNNEIWLLASHPGDEQHKSSVQQGLVHLAPNKAGTPQVIRFPQLPDQPAGTQSVKLEATSDAGLPVHYYVREGPAEVQGDTLVFTPIPPRAKFPLKVTVVAWQWGRSAEPKVQTAAPVEMTFSLTQSR